MGKIRYALKIHFAIYCGCSFNPEILSTGAGHRPRRPLRSTLYTVQCTCIAKRQDSNPCLIYHTFVSTFQTLQISMGIKKTFVNYICLTSDESRSIFFLIKETQRDGGPKATKPSGLYSVTEVPSSSLSPSQ